MFVFFENFERFRFRSNFGKTSSLVKISNQFDFYENFDFGPNFQKFSILINFETFRVWSKFRMNFIFRKFRNISILVKIFEKFRFPSNLQKNFRFGLIFVKNFDFVQNFRKFRKFLI